jgi:hypothetical protein
LVREVLEELSWSLGRLYASEGRPSVPPEQLLCALLLQVLYGIRSERQLMELLDYNLLYRWFAGLSPDEPLLSDEHFSVNGALIGAWASQKSFRPKDGSDSDGTDFHGQQRDNQTHASVTDPESRLYRKAKGREARLCYMGHVTMENRHGLVVGGMVTQADGTAERRASEAMLKAKRRDAGHRVTAGEDKAYDTAAHVAALRQMQVTPHVAQNDAETKTGRRRRSAIGARHHMTAIGCRSRAAPSCST